MNIFQLALKDMKSFDLKGTFKIFLPTVTLGTWLGYFAGEPKFDLWFYFAWPILASLGVLAIIYVVLLLKLLWTKK